MAPKNFSNSSYNETGLQTFPCSKKSLRGRQDLPTKCFVCAGRGLIAKDSCRFKDFRILKAEPGPPTFQLLDASKLDATNYPFKFNTVLKRKNLIGLQYSLAREMQKVIIRMQEHENAGDLLRRQPESLTRVICDSCSTPIFSSSFLCVLCGYELCSTCHTKNDHSQAPLCDADREEHCFRPLSRIPAGQVAEVARQVAQTLALQERLDEYPITIDAKAFQCNAELSRRVPVLTAGREDVFRFLWSRDIPVVVTGIQANLQGSWTPAAFVETHGEDLLTMITVARQGSSTRKATVREFFQEFTQDDKTRGHVVKVKDWPPSTSFSDSFKPYCEAFMDAVPMPSYTRNDGYRNLAAHYPEHTDKRPTFKPDLGPKMYIATRDIDERGSTPLHLDATCAVNILVHEELTSPSSTQCGAYWEVYAREDTPKLRQYLRESGHSFSGDPVHARSIYVTRAMRDDLKKISVVPYEIHQRYGQAVFIPAGCAHQVSNLGACIKIATDFLCVEGIPASIAISKEFQAEAEEGLLPLDAMLWHSWASISRQLGLLPLEEPPVLNRKQKKRKARQEALRAIGDSVGHEAKRSRRGADAISATFSSEPSFTCPELDCRKPTRTYVLDGVLCHLRQCHSIQIDRQDRDYFAQFSSRSFPDVYGRWLQSKVSGPMPRV